MATYLDTSVIVARYMPADPAFNAVERLFRASPEARYISEISVLELHCVFSRLIRGGMLSARIGLSSFAHLETNEKVKVAVEHAIRSWRLSVAAPQRTYARFPLSRQTIEIQHELFEANRTAPTFGLKALDMLHLTYAKTMRESVPDLKTFTTLDGEIISRRREIQDELDIKVVSPLDEPSKENDPPRSYGTY
jgi:predicted nucleic acid-binding protein